MALQRRDQELAGSADARQVSIDLGEFPLGHRSPAPLIGVGAQYLPHLGDRKLILDLVRG